MKFLQIRRKEKMCKELENKINEDYERFLFDQRKELLNQLEELEHLVKLGQKELINNDFENFRKIYIKKELLKNEIIEKYCK